MSEYEPRIKVAAPFQALADGCDGWVDCEDLSDDTAVLEAIREQFADDPDGDAINWSIVDHDGWGPLDPTNWDLSAIAAMGRGIAEHGYPFIVWVGEDGLGPTPDNADDDALDAFTKTYSGEWDSPAEYAKDLARSIGAIPEELTEWWPLHGNVDWDGAADDLKGDGYTFVLNPRRGSYLVFQDR